MQETRQRLAQNGLKVTPQRVVILETIMQMKKHPTVEQIYEKVRVDHPNISLATIYKVMATFVEKGMVQTMLTSNDIKMYEPNLEPHFHIYYTDSNSIEDYFDDELSDMLNNYFRKKNIANLNISDIRVHILAKSTA